MVIFVPVELVLHQVLHLVVGRGAVVARRHLVPDKVKKGNQVKQGYQKFYANVDI